MKKAWLIARRDFRSYFTSPIAYIVTAGFLFIMGWMFFGYLSFFNTQNRQYQQFNMGKGMSIAEGIVRPLLGNMNVILLFILPFVTMRLLAEEKKMHTLELLLTSPVKLSEVVLGKFLAAMGLLTTMVGLSLVYPAILFLTGEPDMGSVWTGYLGTYLMGACIVAIGTLFSSMTENQIVAGALTFASALFFWLINWGAQNAGAFWGEILQYLSLLTHYSSFSQGTINTSDLVYYLSFIGTSLFLTHRVLDSYRWR